MATVFGAVVALALAFAASDRWSTAAASDRVLQWSRALDARALRQRAEPVEAIADPAVQRDIARLQRALADFRATHGVGRAIAAPQIGVQRRIVALHLRNGSDVALVNPRVAERSDDTRTLWDDCFSLDQADLLVRVRRHASVTVAFRDARGTAHEWRDVPFALAELLQHEIDHLDGILAVDREETLPGEKTRITRAAYARNRAHFDALVDAPNGNA